MASARYRLFTRSLGTTKTVWATRKRILATFPDKITFHVHIQAAITVHTGPYDGLGDAHAAVEQWLDAQGLQSGGPLREVYLTDLGEVPNPADWKTEIVWPIQTT